MIKSNQDPQKWASFELRTNQRFTPAPEPPEGAAQLLCATIAINDDDRIESFNFNADGIDDTMDPATCIGMLQILQRLLETGYTLVSWNGLGHDLPSLAHSTEKYEACREIALAHHDLMFQFHCYAGFPVSLRNAAQGMQVPLGEHRQQQIEAADLWPDVAMRREVVEQTAQDARTTIKLARSCQERAMLSWITAKGARRRMPFPHGLLAVQDAMWLPEPDTSWMDNPIPRSEFYHWLT